MRIERVRYILILWLFSLALFFIEQRLLQKFYKYYNISITLIIPRSYYKYAFIVLRVCLLNYPENLKH